MCTESQGMSSFVLTLGLGSLFKKKSDIVNASIHHAFHSKTVGQNLTQLVIDFPCSKGVQEQHYSAVCPSHYICTCISSETTGQNLITCYMTSPLCKGVGE